MEAYFVPALFIGVGILFAMLLAIATGAERLQRISGWILAPAGLIGLALYANANLRDASDVASYAYGIVQSVYSTCAMFLGNNDFSGVRSSLDSLGAGAQSWCYLLFWLAHLGAMFVTASAVLSTLGKKLLQTIRFSLVFLRPKMMYVIFGLHEQSLLLGQDLAGRKGARVIYMDPYATGELTAKAIAHGAIVRKSRYLIDKRVNQRLLRFVRFQTGGHASKIRFMLLEEEESINVAFCQALIEHLTQQRVNPERVCIDLRCRQELDYTYLETLFRNEQSKLYDINVYSDAELSARLLVHEAAPYKVMSFDESGKATHDFHALIIGFGQVGQNVLRQIVMNGQFNGSTLTADIVDVAIDQVSGQFARQYRGVMDAYNIRFHAVDVRSESFYQHLDRWSSTVCYIAICLDSDDINYEVTANLERYFTKSGKAKRPVILVNVCNRKHVIAMKKDIRFFDCQRRIYNGDIFLRACLKNGKCAGWRGFCASSRSQREA